MKGDTAEDVRQLEEIDEIIDSWLAGQISAAEALADITTMIDGDE